MRRAIVNPDICKNCTTCLVEKNCLNTAIIRESEEDIPWIDFYQCRGCMKCLNYCSYNAVEEITHPCTGKPGMGW